MPFNLMRSILVETELPKVPIIRGRSFRLYRAFDWIKLYLAILSYWRK